MKILILNGSTKENGSTAEAVKICEETLHECGIETETVFLGKAPVKDCVACLSCRKTGKCAFDGGVNEFAQKARDADGFVFATPVYYAHPTGNILSFLDRLFYSQGSTFAFKPAGTISVSRRAGGVCSMDVLNKYFSISSMPIVSSTYWNEPHAKVASELLCDTEGVETVKNMAKNLAWMVKCFALAKENGITPPENKKVFYNFIR